MGAQGVKEGRGGIHLGLTDAQLLDNNLLHLLLNCHDSSWDFCERVDFSYLRGFSASRCVVPNPPFCHILANPARKSGCEREKAAGAEDFTGGADTRSGHESSVAEPPSSKVDSGGHLALARRVRLAGDAAEVGGGGM